MPDLLVGAPISAEDFPRAVWASDATPNNNITSTAYITGTPVCAATFTAPTSGSVLLSVGLGASDNGGSNRVFIAPEVRVGSAAGAVVLAPNELTRGASVPGEATANAHRSRTTLLTGLTPGQVYYARTMHKVSGGATADIAVREVVVTPTPLGSSAAGREVRALDYPPAVWAQDTTTITDPTNPGYIAGTPTVAVTFVAPTSGRVLLVVGGGLGNAAGGDRIFLSPEVRENNVSGAVVLVPSVTSRGYGSDKCSATPVFGSRESVLEGLTPGQVYYARVMYAVQTGDAGASSQDISAREIIVAPLP